MVNSAMRENDWFTHYFVDPIHQEQNLQLHEKIIDRSFTILYGTRAFGKSTRVLRTISQLEKEGYICSYVNFEQIGVFDTNFWSSLGTSIYVHNRGKLFKSCVEIKNSRDFLLFFSKATWEGPEDKRVVLFFDEFDKMYTIDEKIRNEFLQILRSIRNDINSYAIQAIFAIGTFAILHIDSRFSEASNSNLTSPFNIKDSIHNPNFTLDQVQALYTEFGKDNIITIEMGVIQDIHTRTNGHAGLVCLCGRAIENHLISLLDNNRIISIDLWERFSVNELIEEVIEYQTFRSLVQSLQSSKAKTALKFFREYFLPDADYEEKIVIDITSAEFLTAEGVLVPGRRAGSFKLSSSLVRWLILQRVIPKAFPSCPHNEVPFYNSGDLNILSTLEYAVSSFDRDIIKLASIRSFKIARVYVDGVLNRYVPRESVYDAELYRVLWNWLSINLGFQITGQWHMISYRDDGNNRRQHNYSDIVITSRRQKIVLELLATATKGNLDEHFGRALNYARILSANETWIVHFTCEDDFIFDPYWPSDDILRNGLNVLHIWHDLSFKKFKTIACWWSNSKNFKRVTSIKTYPVQG
ncbi:hypothetical protein RclHR1_02320010 [Rhizophagus clarus]|uniref:ATPase domain-containing protein n=1 Tax=Rhizophagus clarus TaxID=94130 RepID=A0A2Z6QXG9_9GLOM|nr:hypothetical protein RclHR1_02320010 [Rhizophagus clarus]